MQAALSLTFNEIKIQNHHQDHAEKKKKKKTEDNGNLLIWQCQGFSV